MRRRLGKTLCSVLLTLAMVIGLLTGVTQTVNADMPENACIITITDSGTYTMSPVPAVFTAAPGDSIRVEITIINNTDVTYSEPGREFRPHTTDSFTLTFPYFDGRYINTWDWEYNGSDGSTIRGTVIAHWGSSTVDVTGVSLNHDSLSLEVGETYDLVAEITPDDATDKTVTWSSDNTAVATVSDGVVTAVAEGTANITVTATNGTDVTSDDKTATCTVTVTDSDTPTPDPDPDTPTPDPDPDTPTPDPDPDTPTPDPDPVTPSDPPAPVITPEQAREMTIRNFVERMYLIALDRSFDVSGRDYWVDQIYDNNASGSDIARGFLGSREFLGRDLTNEEFVTILYKVFYDSVPQTGSYTNWVDALYNGTMTRSELIDNFASSYEWASFCARYGVNV